MFETASHLSSSFCNKNRSFSLVHIDESDDDEERLDELQITNVEVEGDRVFVLVTVEEELDGGDESLFAKSKTIFEEKVIINYKHKYFY